MSQTPSASSQASSSSSSFKPIPLTAAAGVLSITQPQQTATSFFKIASGELITFGWNFTAVLATPTHLTVSAVCDNGNTYPVGPTDGIIPGTATEVVWDVWSYQQAHSATPLAQASYTLNIWDDRGPGASVKPGFLQENSALQFAMYTPQAYTPLASGWTCPACSDGVMSFAAHPAFVSLIVTIFIAVFSGVHLLRSSAR
ncbi:hypothetical protein HYPSUDRAFT_41019 [Hypholoma sublateritium FD-334 SS-4]|uniref:DUF7137 domain-containing protein n=1 Tax=Hypholoma sublateritium (strain FD-334 SS-4) TaxID=945553 RepID=A0A0D2L662_HYPSF|nr:hypothetical protein HYPSUDRAFT_41019 [Hypholoma sublateritium FD-334 SS-4]